MIKKKTMIIIMTIICISIILILAFWGMVLNPSKKLTARIVVSTSYAFVNEIIQFNGSQSSGDIEKWIWDFDDGNVSEEQSPSHAFTLSDYYNVSLTVIDSDDNRDNAIQNISIQNLDLHEEESGTNLFDPLGTDGDAIVFTVFTGITKPTIYASWSGSANLADIRAACNSQSILLFEERRRVILEEFNINTVVNPPDIVEFGNYAIVLRCMDGKVNEYFLEVEVHY